MIQLPTENQNALFYELFNEVKRKTLEAQPESLARAPKKQELLATLSYYKTEDKN